MLDIAKEKRTVLVVTSPEAPIGARVGDSVGKPVGKNVGALVGFPVGEMVGAAAQNPCLSSKHYFKCLA